MNAFAQSSGATSRAVVVAYTMPIWSTLLAALILGDQLNRMRVTALVLCASGLLILVQPLFAGGVPLGALYALVCAISWAIGTIYVKWVRMDIEPLTSAAWQLLAGFIFMTAAMLIFDGPPRPWPIHAASTAGLVYNGLVGFGFAYLIWFNMIEQLPTATASIGSLLVPVVGFIGAILVLGERPNMSDMIGFAHDLRGGGLRAAAAERQAPGDAGVSSPPRDAATSAKLMVVVIGLVWGFNWVAARIILSVLPPWTMRALGIGLGAATLFAAASLTGVRCACRAASG